MKTFKLNDRVEFVNKWLNPSFYSPVVGSEFECKGTIASMYKICETPFYKVHWDNGKSSISKHSNLKIVYKLYKSIW